MKDMWKYSELIPRVVYVTGMTKPEAAVVLKHFAIFTGKHLC